MTALDGIHVLDLSLLLPGPLATQILRDLGARVTKIEPPAPGDYMALWPPLAGPTAATYQVINRGKEIISLDLKTEAGKARFFELAATADVVLEGFRPGVIDKLGIGYDRVAAANPRIIVCSISGYGQDGPHRLRGGHDLNYQGLAGVLSIAGLNGPHPTNPRLQIADTAAGSYGAAMLIMAALVERQRTGRGRYIDVSMSEQLLPLMTTLYAAAEAEGHDPRADGELLSGGVPSYRIYRTADNRAMTVGALEPKFWQALATAIDQPELTTVSHVGGEHSPEMIARLTAIFRTKTRDEWTKIFAGVDACVEPLLTFSEARQHPQWQARGSFETFVAADGRALSVPKLPGSLAGFNDTSKPT